MGRGGIGLGVCVCSVRLIVRAVSLVLEGGS